MPLVDGFQYSGNDMFLSIDGVEVALLWVGNATFTPTNSPTDISSGAESEHEKWNPGMNSTEMTVNLYFSTDKAERDIYFPLIKPGVKRTWIFGTMGDDADAPKLEQKFIVSTAPHTVGQKLDQFVQFALTLKGADGPISDYWTSNFP